MNPSKTQSCSGPTKTPVPLINHLSVKNKPSLTTTFRTRQAPFFERDNPITLTFDSITSIGFFADIQGCTLLIRVTISRFLGWFRSLLLCDLLLKPENSTTRFIIYLITDCLFLLRLFPMTAIALRSNLIFALTLWGVILQWTASICLSTSTSTSTSTPIGFLLASSNSIYHLDHCLDSHHRLDHRLGHRLDHHLDHHLDHRRRLDTKGSKTNFALSLRDEHQSTTTASTGTMTSILRSTNIHRSVSIRQSVLIFYRSSLSVKRSSRPIQVLP